MNSRKFNTQKVKETTGNLLFSIVLFILSFTIFSNSVIACINCKTYFEFENEIAHFGNKNKTKQVFFVDQSEIKETDDETKSVETKFFLSESEFFEYSLVLFIDKSFKLDDSEFIFETSQTPFYIMYCSLKSYLF